MKIEDFKKDILSKFLPLAEEHNYRAGWLGCEYESGKCDGICEAIAMLDLCIDINYFLKNSYARLLKERKGHLEPWDVTE